MFWTLMVFFFLMIRRPPRSTRTDTLVPYTTLFRSPERPRVSAAAEHWPSAGGYPSCRDMTACLRHLQEKDDGQPGSTETARPEPAAAGRSRPRSPAAATTGRPGTTAGPAAPQRPAGQSAPAAITTPHRKRATPSTEERQTRK